ncbi:class I SAM-dependent methyltransferase [Rubripirellula amarantea]|uniref:Class I SAM-dependent methyltransferase n=1 Tax=Rubripirellula amarantea TaxID=2527999 RepID=A0A5C5WIJ9_9BACT|nr:class I SAM-dependent methyltransferase [Rubripirellula amarantea]MDA8743868.1 class I SAM-dependent methyltransferase [Rubripirellula amarantea]TWT49642.1 hypothetical protein Pla22_48400 [Rubripirellula amarantea]
MKSKLKAFIKAQSFGVHRLLSRAGLHVSPVHYYSAQPDVITLEKTREDWAKPSAMPGVAVDLDAQVETLRQTCLPYQDEYDKSETFAFATQNNYGPGYGAIEAQCLHAFIRHHKPSRVVEVGSGVSTQCMYEAFQINQKESPKPFEITCVEPYPSDKLRQMNVNLIEKFVQRVAFEDCFEALGEGDLLFIDSSHAVKPGSDVNYLFLEILPRIRPGVLVHIHDIYLPYDYAPKTLHTYLHWMETSLLRAFLTHNHKVEILFCQSHLHHERPDALRDVFPSYQPLELVDGLYPDGMKSSPAAVGKHFPSSIYLRIK